MSKQVRRSARGATLIEAMIAAAVLVIGLTGITIMLKASAAATRDAVMSQNAAAYSAALLDETASLGYCGLAAASNVDGGILNDSTGRRYGRVMNVAAGGSASIPTFSISVRTDWSDSLGTVHQTNLSTLVPRLSDAGC
jgi:Tfp pilus assembly protein PilV